MDENRQDTQVEERNATLDEEPTPTLSAEEAQARILEDSGMNAFQKFCARMDDRRWTIAQRVTGVLMGVAAGVALFWDTLSPAAEGEKKSAFTVPMIIAIVIALILPNILEKQSQRRIPKLRVAMVIALAVVIVIYFIVVSSRTGLQFFN